MIDFVSIAGDRLVQVEDRSAHAGPGRQLDVIDLTGNRMRPDCQQFIGGLPDPGGTRLPVGR